MNVDFTECDFTDCSLKGTQFHQMPRSKTPNGELLGHFAMSKCGNFVISSLGDIYRFNPGQTLTKVAVLLDFPKPYHPGRLVKCCHVVVSGCGRFVGCGGPESMSWTVHRVPFADLLEQVSSVSENVLEIGALMKYTKPKDAEWISVEHLAFSEDGEFVFARLQEGGFISAMIARTSSGKGDGNQHNDFTWRKSAERSAKSNPTGVPMHATFFRNPSEKRTPDENIIFAAMVHQAENFGARGTTHSLALYYFDEKTGTIAEPFAVLSHDIEPYMTYLPKRQCLALSNWSAKLDMYRVNPGTVDFTDKKHNRAVLCERDFVKRPSSSSSSDKDVAEDLVFFSDCERFVVASHQGVVIINIANGMTTEKIVNVLLPESFALSNDEKMVFVGRDDSIFTFMVEAGGPEVPKPDCHKEPVTGLCYDEATQQLVSVSNSTYMNTINTGATLSKTTALYRSYVTVDEKFTITEVGAMSRYSSDWEQKGSTTKIQLKQEGHSASKLLYSDNGTFALTSDKAFIATNGTLKTEDFPHLQDELSTFTDQKTGETRKIQETRQCIRIFHLSDALDHVERASTADLSLAHIALIYSEAFEENGDRWHPERVIQFSPDEKHLLVVELLDKCSENKKSISHTNKRRLVVFEVPNLRDTTTKGENGLPRQLKMIAHSDGFHVLENIHERMIVLSADGRHLSLVTVVPAASGSHLQTINLEFPSLQFANDGEKERAVAVVTDRKQQEYFTAYKWNKLLLSPDGHTCVGARFTQNLFAVHLFDADNDSGWKSIGEAQQAREPKERVGEDFSKRLDLRKNEVPKNFSAYRMRFVATFSPDGAYLMYADPTDKGDKVYVVKIHHDKETGVSQSEFIHQVFVGSKATQVTSFKWQRATDKKSVVCFAVGTAMGGVLTFDAERGTLLQQFGPREQQLTAHGAKGIDSVTENVVSQMLLYQLA